MRGRILYWTEQFWPRIGGVEVLSAQLIPDLIARGYDIQVITADVLDTEAPPHDAFDGIAIHRLPMRRAIEDRDLRGMKACWETVARVKRSFDPHVVHLNTSGPSLFFHQKTSGISGAKTLFNCHGLWGTVHVAPRGRATSGNSLLSQVVQQADHLTAVSATVERDLIALGADPRRTSVVYNGLKAPREPAPPICFDPPTFLCAGRLVKGKGIETAIDAFGYVAAEHARARLLIAGGGEERDALAERARAVSDAIVLLGWVEPEAMHAHMAAASAVLVPSSWEEPFGLVAAEAGQVARPAVVTRVGGLPEVVADGETGLVVPKDDARAMADAMIALIDDPRHAKALGKAAQARVERLFGWDRYVEEIDRHYQRLIGDRS